MIRIDLPLPAEQIHPNGRTRNYQWRAKLVKHARSIACLLGREQRPKLPYRKATVQATFHLPRRRDGDNLNAWLKPYLDGFQDARIVENDSAFTLLPPRIVLGKQRKVIIEIEGE